MNLQLGRGILGTCPLTKVGVDGNVPDSTHRRVTGILKKLGDVPSIIIPGMTCSRPHKSNPHTLLSNISKPRSTTPSQTHSGRNFGISRIRAQYLHTMPTSATASAIDKLRATLSEEVPLCMGTVPLDANISQLFYHAEDGSLGYAPPPFIRSN